MRGDWESERRGEGRKVKESNIFSSIYNLIPLSGPLFTVSGTHFPLSHSLIIMVTGDGGGGCFINHYRFYLIELGLSTRAGNGKMHLIKVKPSNKSQSLKRKWKQKVQPQMIKLNQCTNRAVRLKHPLAMSCDVYEVSRRLIKLIILGKVDVQRLKEFKFGTFPAHDPVNQLFEQELRIEHSLKK